MEMGHRLEAVGQVPVKSDGDWPGVVGNGEK